MTVDEAIELTKNYTGLKCSVSGMIANKKKDFQQGNLIKTFMQPVKHGLKES